LAKTGLCGECCICGWGHSKEQYEEMGIENPEQTPFANRIIIDGEIYCPDCAKTKV
jgi:hypothetical protein